MNEDADACIQAPDLWLEDLVPGQVFRFGDYPVAREEVIEFASRYDPQPFHLDDEAAAANPLLGKLCASGMHTMSMAHLLMMRGFGEVGIRPLAGAGMDKMRLHRPVFPGDTLHIEIEITETRPIRSRSDRGLLSYLTKVVNQDGLEVMSYQSLLFMSRRPAQD
ncbi:MAG: MaoC family dehydratase [Pseudomonadota bacterium]|jgi:acyl dehydratase